MLAGDAPEPAGAAVAVLADRGGPGFLEPVGPFPAVQLAERRPEPGQPRVQRGAAHVAAGGQLQLGPVHRVQPAQPLAGPVVQEPSVGLDPGEPAHVEPAGVELRHPGQDPGRQLAAHGGREDDALGIHPGRHEQAFDLVGLAQGEVGVGGEALGGVEEPVKARRGDGGHGALGVPADGREVVPVGGELGEATVRDPRRAARDAVGLERADQQPPELVPEVVAVIEVAQHREGRAHPRDRVGPDVHVLGRVQGYVRARGRGQVPGPQAARQHDHFGGDVALAGPDPGHPAAGGEHVQHADVLAQGHSPVGGQLGERDRGVARVDAAVAGKVQGARDAVPGGQRPQLREALPGERLGLDVVLAGDVAGVGELVDPAGGTGQRDRPGPGEVDVDPGPLLQSPVHPQAVAGQLGQRAGGAGPGDQARGVPGGAAAEPVGLQDQDVTLALGGQVRGHAGPDDPAAHDHDAGPAGQGIVMVAGHHGRGERTVSKLFHGLRKARRPCARSRGVPRGRASRAGRPPRHRGRGWSGWPPSGVTVSEPDRM